MTVIYHNVYDLELAGHQGQGHQLFQKSSRMILGSLVTSHAAWFQTWLTCLGDVVSVILVL